MEQFSQAPAATGKRFTFKTQIGIEAKDLLAANRQLVIDGHILPNSNNGKATRQVTLSIFHQGSLICNPRTVWARPRFIERLERLQLPGAAQYKPAIRIGHLELCKIDSPELLDVEMVLEWN